MSEAMFDPEMQMVIRELDLQRPEIRRRMEALALVGAAPRPARSTAVSRAVGSGLVTIGTWLEGVGRVMAPEPEMQNRY
ncbi:MAG TPA: hypothetical protein VH951_02525 [Dehalococcoidia bacterium]